MGRRASTRACDLDGCERKHHANGLCKKHSEKKRITGTLEPIHHKYQSIMADAVKSNIDECIIWPSRLGAGGYGVVTHEGKQTPVHRVVLIKAKGLPPSPSHVAAHAPVICHDRRCINPKHLRWATRAENEADKALDGTRAFGEFNGNAKLTDGEVKSIKADQRKNRDIAEEFGVSRSLVSMLKGGKRWKHTTE